MLNQRIEIYNFGPIKNACFDIKKFNIIIGESSTGKSLIGKWIYFFQTVPEYIKQKKSENSNEKETLHIFYSYLKNIFNNYNSYITEETKIIFLYGKNKQIVLSNNIDEIDFTILNEIDIIPDSILYQLAARSIYLKFNEYHEIYKETDPILDKFLSYKIIYEKYLQDHKSENISDIYNNLSQEILKSSYIIKNKQIYLIDKNNAEFKISEASSGQQEVLPIIEMIEYLIKTNKSAFCIIEEPEAHIYPITQYNLVKMISYFNNFNNSNRILITTHSPYILGAINNLVYAASVNDSDSNAKINEILPESLWIKFLDLGAYKIENGILTDICDKEMKLIDNIQIDEASKMINQDYDRIFEYE